MHLKGHFNKNLNTVELQRHRLCCNFCLVHSPLNLLDTFYMNPCRCFDSMDKPPSSVRCSRRCVASPRCWSRWRPRRWRCCTRGCRGSGGSSGCSQWWPRSRTWGCTWWPAPGTAGSRRAWWAPHKVSYRQPQMADGRQRRDHWAIGAKLKGFINLY